MPGDNFFPVVRNAGVVLFYDVHLEALAGLFVGGEPLAARQALASASDYPPAVAGTRVNYLILSSLQKGHLTLSPPRFRQIGTPAPNSGLLFAVALTGSTLILKPTP